VLRRVFIAALVLIALFTSRRALAEPQRATIGIYVNQVANLDLKANTFTIDFWLWFRAAPQPSSPIDTFEVIDGRINSKTNIIKKVLANGEHYAAARVNATIHRQWDLRRYPFDDHDLEVAIEDADLDATRCIFVIDAESSGKDPNVVVSGWDIEDLQHDVSAHYYPSNYGDLSIAPGPETRYSRYVARLHARRRGSARFLKVAFPLLVSVVIAWCAFFVRPKDAGPKVAVSVGALFAAAAGTVAINSQLPDINYATVIDLTVFLSLGMISVSLLATVASLSLHYAGKETMHRRVDTVCGALFPLVFALLLFLIVR
jgi:hypothetical protein